MKLHRTLAVFLLAASVCGGVHAQSSIYLDDETIFVAVEEALRVARSLAGADITVRSREGFVTLSGFARSMEDIAAAGRIAARVRGVTGVKNELRVADRPSRA
jgi:hyperosmotically inducible protein